MLVWEQDKFVKNAKVAEIVDKIRNGDRRLAARLMRDVDDNLAAARVVLAELYRHTGRAHIIGITGNPGAGKSTLVNQLIKRLRQQDKTVAVLAIDPTSPFSGGAILGDRIRMQDHVLDPGVFIRSVATRGNLGGLSRSSDDLVNIFDAMGFDVVIIETVGVGQDEVEIVRTAHSSLVVLVPGLGDEVQALKAGILEIADVFVVNKSDREGSDRTAQEIRSMMTLGDSTLAARAAAGDAAAHHGFAPKLDVDPREEPTQEEQNGPWDVPVLKAMALRGEGIDELLSVLQQHFVHLQQSGQLDARRRRRVHESYARLTRDMLWQQALEQQDGEAGLVRSVDQILLHETDPYTAARSFVQNSLGKI